MSGGQRLGLILAAVLAAVVAFVALRPADDEDGSARSSTAETVPAAPVATARSAPPPPAGSRIDRIALRDGRPVAGVRRIEAKRGDTVRIVVRSDAPQLIHLHGYDIHRYTAPGAPARFRFEADVEGVFEIEVERPAVQVAELRVEP